MINSGQPLFRQEAAADSAPEESGAPVKPARKRKAVDRVHSRLSLSSSWQSEPLVAGQAELYPDTVKVISERYMTLDVASQVDMDTYSKIAMSHDQNGHYRITLEKEPQWDDKQGTYKILLRVQERMFKTTKTSDLIPGD